MTRNATMLGKFVFYNGFDLLVLFAIDFTPFCINFDAPALRLSFKKCPGQFVFLPVVLNLVSLVRNVSSGNNYEFGILNQ